MMKWNYFNLQDVPKRPYARHLNKIHPVECVTWVMGPVACLEREVDSVEEHKEKMFGGANYI